MKHHETPSLYGPNNVEISQLSVMFAMHARRAKARNLWRDVCVKEMVQS